MTKKRKRYPDLNQKLERPWCFYCERDFDDLKILISHQKAKHFKCDRCGRRLNTAGGLSVHMNQVHKENLTHVENAISGRQGLDIEIFGMEGVPADIVDQHNQQVTQKHFAEEAERARLTGNPVRGLYANGQAPPNKRKKVHETLDDIEARAAQFRHDRQNGILPAVAVDVAPNPTPPTTTPYTPFPPQSTHLPTNGTTRPTPNTASALPARPGFPGAPAPAAAIDEAPAPAPASTTASDAAAAAAGGADKDRERKEDKKSRKSANFRLVFFDERVSPEEKMAALPRFAVVA